jgi:hypothetical protein
LSSLIPTVSGWVWYPQHSNNSQRIATKSLRAAWAAACGELCLEFVSERRIEDPIVTLWMPFDGSHDVAAAVDVAILDAVRSKAQVILCRAQLSYKGV